METVIQWNNKRYRANLSRPIDISIPLRPGPDTVNCFYAPHMEATPYTSPGFIGSVARGGPVNFLNLRLNPHGNGTHTESVGHVSEDLYPINRALRNFHFIAELVSVYPRKLENGDRIIEGETLSTLVTGGADALILRTLPNGEEKRKRQYSGSNPPYISVSCMEWIVSRGYEHLLVDLPSVDREEDGGKLAAHKIFWEFYGNRQIQKTITELIYVPDHVEDGIYLLNLQIAAFEIDASPSKPVLYELEELH